MFDRFLNFLLRILKPIVLIAILALFVSLVLKECNKPDTPKEIAYKQEISKLQAGESILVREENGIKIWKFLDKSTSHYVYFTSRGDVSWNENCGKNCNRTISNFNKE